MFFFLRIVSIYYCICNISSSSTSYPTAPSLIFSNEQALLFRTESSFGRRYEYFFPYFRADHVWGHKSSDIHAYF